MPKRQDTPSSDRIDDRIVRLPSLEPQEVKVRVVYDPPLEPQEVKVRVVRDDSANG